MLRRLVGAFALTFILCAALAPVAAGDPARLLPMQFTLRQEGPASACADKCRMWVSATGMIKPETARDFETFAERNNLRGMTMVLDSEGGSVLGAMTFGRAVRRLEMVTTVGKTNELPSAKGEGRRATLSPRADCESMCVFVLLAGAKRIVPPEARVRVHQIWLGDRREDATAAVYSAEDLVLVQRDIGKLAQYTVEMGGAVDLLELSLRIPPWEPMRSLTREELRRMKLDTVEAVADQPTGSATATSAPVPANIHRISVSGERGWTMIERSGAPMLARRHPLTVEGETIGSFDVMFTCGTAPNEFGVLYMETRRTRGGISAPEPLRDVEISIGARTAPLTVGASELQARPDERNTSASGVLTLAEVKNFADSTSRSLTVATSNTKNIETSIRIGNTGIAQYFPQLASTCAQQAPTTHAGLTPQ